MNADELAAIAERFGVADSQVERDHLISYLLALLSENFRERVVFIGGTALARTHLPEGRLSEDIDLIALDRRNAVAADLDRLIPRALQRTHGRLTWVDALSDVPDTTAAYLTTGEGLAIKIQLLASNGYQRWPTELRELEQRYGDAPPARLHVPTRAAFAASKTATWQNRRAPRDLWDLWALNRIGAIDTDAAVLYRRHGPTNKLPAAHDFAAAPGEAEWQSQLAGQTRLGDVTAVSALGEVRAAWARLRDGDQPDDRGRIASSGAP
ncbi:nucleotidyl transferase AbiEii/AbiGii toxin family protein [Prescottella defluvii]|uniref:nucleotidyl transferase AbiEii/AbiGii toxin family protein n=1 Tax=Prescottella defluvii TaxID=1323361 RepID=UPI0004F26EE0|nr:nucleotidyl transferase AbiEii/AbiGii toxin family protein [Prescottella defluvii]